jgi:hypothetical protein
MAFKIKRFIPESPLHIEGSGQGNSSSIKGTSADKRTYNPFATKPKVKKEKPVEEVESKPKPRKKVKAIEPAIEPAKARKIKAEDKKVSEISTKKPTVKVAPKEVVLSRKAIRQRKKADKAAGVSKSQMRANKAKSKAEAALEKAKKSKNPSYKAQLKRKADRLAARAKRKGGSPVKAVGDPKLPKLQVKKTSKKKVDKDPVKYFKSFPSKATQRTAKNPYPKESARNRKFAQLQKKLEDSSM